jgi:hypothetical protein
MMTNDWMKELEDSRTSGLWFEINGVGAGELLDFILAKDAEIERLREVLKQIADYQKHGWIDGITDIARAALKGDE